jgi:two-component sensor histidine kinase
MPFFRSSLLLLIFLVVFALSGQSQNGQVDAILTTPRDITQLRALNVAIAELINTSQLVPDTLFDQTIALADELGKTSFISNLYVNRSAYNMNLGEFDQGLIYADKAIKSASVDEGQEELLAAAYSVKLRLMMRRGDIKEAADLATELVKEYQIKEDKINEARTHLLLSTLSTSLGDYPMTMVFDSTAIALSRQSGDVDMLVHSLYTAAENFNLLGYPEKSLVLVAEAMELLKENKLKYVLGNIVNARMGANTALGRYDEALEDYETLKKEEGDVKFAWWMTTRGMLLQRVGRNAEARTVLLDAVKSIKETSNAPVSLKRTYIALQTVDLNQTQYDTVVYYGKLIRAQEDSLQVVRNIKHLQELDEKYKAREKEAEIRLQKEKLAAKQTQLYWSGAGLLLALGALLGFFLLNERLKKRNQENELLLRDKETLIGEIHHRVKNNLQVISSLLQLQRRGLESDDGKGRDALLESQSRVSAMGLIHNKLYQGTNITAVYMPKYLEDLGETLLDAYRLEEQVDIYYDVEDVSLDVDVAIPLGLIINELITNSIKYAFPGGREGIIEISLHRENGQIELLVADDGVGVAAAEKRADSTAFGANLIELLTKKLKGELTLLDTKGYGIKIVFPEKII